MADPHWTIYAGMVTGIVGAILVYLGYRKSKQIKALDLRIELKRAVANIIFDFKNLREQMEKGNKSRMAVAAAMGFLNSGRMNKWKKGFEYDQKAANELAKELPDEDTYYDHLDTNELEAKLIESHKIQRKIQKLSEKYSEEITRDDEQRKQIRENMRSRINP